MAVEPVSLESDHRLGFRDNENLDVVVLSGYATYTGLRGDSDEDLYKEYKVEAIVGPFWRSVDDVSPLLLRAGLEHPDSDEDDASGYFVAHCTWDLVEDPASPGKRIRLKAMVGVRGENAEVHRLAFRAAAKGTRIAGPIDTP